MWATLFEYDELTINMRQQEDTSYRDLLSRIRIGLLTKSDSEVLENRKISFKSISFESTLHELCNFINDLPSDIVCLLPTCHTCDVLNTAMLNRISSEEILLIAEDTVECIPYVKKKILKLLSDNDDNNSRTAGLSKRITIKIGAKVMIRRNIDASLGLVNDTIGTVISIVKDTLTNNIKKIKLLLPSGMEFLIEKVNVKFELMDRAYVIRKQFPLTLSYGITIHKSQGLSLRNVIVDIGNSVFNCGQVYVALSRVTSIEGLHLINYDPLSIKASEEAIIEYNRLRKIYKTGTEAISISKKRKIKDVLWTLPKIISSVQELYQETRQNTSWIIRGFQNTDNVSCYANTVLQCLLHLNDIRQLLISDKQNVLGKLAHRYENGMAKLNTYRVRKYLGKYFSSNVKRDASEFLMALCTKHDYIKNLLECKIKTTNRCKSCNNTKCFINNNIIISIPLNNLKKKSFRKIQELINITFSQC